MTSVWGPVAVLLAMAAPVRSATQEADLKVYLSRPARRESVGKAPPPADLRAKLETHVRQLVAGGSYCPTYFYIGLGSANAGLDNWYFWKSSELLEALSTAFPHLSRELQTKVRAYLKTEMEKYPPWQRHARDFNAGALREYYAPQSLVSGGVGQVEPSIDVCTALNLYFEATKDRDLLETAYPSLRALAEREAGQEIRSYRQIGGLIAFARIAAALEKSEDAAQAGARAIEALKKGRDFESFLLHKGRLARVRMGNHYYAFHVLRGLTPEVGAFLSEQTRAPADAYLREMTELRPRSYQGNCDLWYLTLGERAINAADTENFCLTPDMSLSIFRAMVFFRREPAEQLVRWVDIPFCKADLTYILKVAWTLDAW